MRESDAMTEAERMSLARKAGAIGGEMTGRAAAAKLRDLAGDWQAIEVDDASPFETVRLQADRLPETIAVRFAFREPLQRPSDGRMFVGRVRWSVPDAGWCNDFGLDDLRATGALQAIEDLVDVQAIVDRSDLGAFVDLASWSFARSRTLCEGRP